MFIKEITSQHRRDIYGTFECEHCGHTTPMKGGYDDAYYHNTVVPNMKCSECGKTAKDASKALKPKYPQNEVV